MVGRVKKVWHARHARLDRRVALKLLALGGGAALLGACSAPAPASSPAATNASTGTAPASTGTSPASTATAAPASQPRSGGTLRAGTLGDLPTLDGSWVAGANTTAHIYDRLVEYDPKLNPIPMLAESWDVNKDWTQLKLNLRRGVQWHTGRQFTSDDVEWNFNRVKTDPKINGGGFQDLIAPLSSMEKPDPNTLIVKADAPWPGAFDLFSLLNMIDPVTMQQPDGVQHPVGTGPFTFVEYVQGDHVTLKKNPSYWQTGKPYLDGLRFQIFTDPQALVTQLEAGALDVAYDPPFRDTARLRQDPQYQVLINDNTGQRVVILQQIKTDGPTSNKQFRQALQYAVNRQRVIDMVFLGMGSPGDLPFAPSSPAYDVDREHRYSFDLDRARALIASSGLANPELDINYASTNTEFALIAQILKSDLATIGVTLNLKPLDSVTATTTEFQAAYPGLFLGRSLYGQLHPSFMEGNPNFSDLVSWANFKSDELTQLTNAIVHETDPAKQPQAYAAWSDYLLDESWAVTLGASSPHTIATRNVHGLHYNLDEMLQANDAWLDT